MRRSPAIFSVYVLSDHATRVLDTSPRDPGVVSLHVNAGYFSTTAMRLTSPTWGAPHPCKQALSGLLIPPAQCYLPPPSGQEAESV